MPLFWSSEPIQLAHHMAIVVHATASGVSIGKQVDGVFASDTLYTPEQAEELAKALITASAHARAG